MLWSLGSLHHPALLEWERMSQRHGFVAFTSGTLVVGQPYAAPSPREGSHLLRARSFCSKNQDLNAIRIKVPGLERGRLESTVGLSERKDL